MTSLNFEAEGLTNTTVHEVRQRARCHNCGVNGNNTYQIVYTGNSDLAMDGAGVKSANTNQSHETPDKAIKV
jgi:hypothetical protein